MSGFFQNKAQVMSYLNNIKSAYSSETDLLETGKIFDTRISELETLRNVLLDLEQKFFQEILGSSTGDPSIDIKILQNKVDEWNKSGASNLVNGGITNIILKIQKLFNGINLEELVEAYKNELIVSEIFKDMATDEGEDIIETVRKYLNEVLRTIDDGKSAKFSKHTFSKKIKIEKKNEKIQLSFSEDISEGYKKRMANIFNSVSQKMGRGIQSFEDEGFDIKKDPKNFAIAITEILQEEGITGAPLNYLSTEIYTNLKAYALSKNFAVTKGFLGEVYWASFFNFLANGKARVIPTGNIKNVLGQSIPIDLILRDFGFQVKMYNIKNGKINLGLKDGSTRLLGNFIVDRAEVSPSEALLLFFGAYGYNQPIEDASSEYVQLYGSFQEYFGIVDQIFQTHIDKIIGIDKGFKQRVNNEAERVFKDEKNYYNSFFLINDKIVPSSNIVQGIIEGFRESEARAKFKGNYSVKETDSNNLWPNKQPKNLVAAANMSQINYEIMINVEDILRKAYDFL